MFAFGIVHVFIKNFSQTNRKVNMLGYIWCSILIITWVSVIIAKVEQDNYSAGDWFDTFCWSLLWEVTLFDSMKIWMQLFTLRIMIEKNMISGVIIRYISLHETKCFIKA